MEPMKPICRLLAAAMLIVSLALILSPVLSEEGSDPVRLVCLNIGKADCLLLLYRDAAYLIDAGYEHTWPALKTMLEQYGVTHLNGVFLTHCHKDHQGGLIPLAKSGVAVDAWYAPRIFFDVKAGEHAARLAAAIRGMETVWLDAGSVIPVSDGAFFTALGPVAVNEDNENNNSLVLRFDSPAGSILFSGDMKQEEEEDLLSAGWITPCDVLKVGHHGDNNAAGKQFLRAASPRTALICTDSREEPDTPAPSTLNRLGKIGAEVYVTQNAHDAYLITLQDHEAAVTDVIWTDVPLRAEGVEIKLDVSGDIACILNHSDRALCLDGCFLYSTKGDEGLYLDGYAVPANGSLTVGTNASGGQTDVYWPVKRVWNQKKRDAAILYDAYGRVLACTDNGLSE